MLKIEHEYETPTNSDHYQNQNPYSNFNEPSINQTTKINYIPHMVDNKKTEQNKNTNNNKTTST